MASAKTKAGGVDKAREQEEETGVSAGVQILEDYLAEVLDSELLFFSSPASWALCRSSLNAVGNHWTARKGGWRRELW